MWCKVSHFVKIYVLPLRASDLGIGDDSKATPKSIGKFMAFNPLTEPQQNQLQQS